jgi:hypothetical protein
VLWLYRSAGSYRWNRRRADGRLIGRAGLIGHPTKAAMWRACRRNNKDFELCRVDDRTFTWTQGGTNLSRPPLSARTPTRLLPLAQLRRRL